MESLLSTIPGTGWMALLVLGLGSVIYLFSRVRKEDMKLLRDANNDLRTGMDDRDKKITGLENAVHVLEIKVETLEKRNKTLEDLVVVALKQYFFENPEIAKKLGDIVK